MGALQAIYDFWWDAFGVLVGTYRRVAFVLVRTGCALASTAIYSHFVLFDALELPFSLLIWHFVLRTAKRRADQDNRDQMAGRLGAVNRRALEFQGAFYVLAVTLVYLTFFGAFCVLDLWFDHKVRLGEDILLITPYFVMCLNEGLMVRERNKSRFSFNRALARTVSAGAA